MQPTYPSAVDIAPDKTISLKNLKKRNYTYAKEDKVTQLLGHKNLFLILLASFFGFGLSSTKLLFKFGPWINGYFDVSPYFTQSVL
ncbi:hypothetical protein [Coxiella-like endosymbiont]|uniref:hypothetical protein n=1 Tax=Coxiella-like endosymbiont TaxID=1592897 RepID=UPI00272ACA76|nr:hypothetical protein [Coxiella-like endosymbiont]